MLHRVSEIRWNNDYDGIAGQGDPVCGLSCDVVMPGIFSRMDLKRCRRCCRSVGTPPGYGAPFNALVGEQKDA